MPIEQDHYVADAASLRLTFHYRQGQWFLHLANTVNQDLIRVSVCFQLPPKVHMSTSLFRVTRIAAGQSVSAGDSSLSAPAAGSEVVNLEFTAEYWVEGSPQRIKAPGVLRVIPIQDVPLPALPPTRPSRISLSMIREVIVRHFNSEELQTLCFDMSVDYDNLAGEGKAAKARELVTHMQRRNRIDVLVQAIRRERGPVL